MDGKGRRHVVMHALADFRSPDGTIYRAVDELERGVTRRT